MSTNIKERHRQTANYIKNTFNKIFNKKIETNKNEVSKENSNKDKFDEINSLLDELMLK